MSNIHDPKIVVIGGGTGSFTLLSGLKHYTRNITSIVTMADDGGSTGVLRDELGVLPPGDARQCLIALSNYPELRELFTYRFSEGGLDGHSFGNLFISALEKITHSFEDALTVAGKVLGINGRVLPMTLDQTTLVLKEKDGYEVRGEHKISNLRFLDQSKPSLSFDPEPSIALSAKNALLEAELIVVAPGNFYGSIVPALMVKGVKSALRRSNAKVVFVCNLVTKPNQTDNFSVSDYADVIERYIGKGRIDYVIYNTDEPSHSLLQKYINDGERIVSFDLNDFENQNYRAIGLPLIDTHPVIRDIHDKIASERTLIRHDSVRIARELMHIYFGD